MLTKKDFEFMREFVKKYNVIEGSGLQNMLTVFLIDYKKSQRKTK